MEKKLLVIVSCFITLMIVVIVLPLDWFLWGIPQIKWTAAGSVNGLVLTGNNFESLPVSYSYLLEFSALGSFSVNNPIDVNVKLENVTLANFLENYQVASFSLAYDYPFNRVDNGAIESAKITLQQIGADSYEGSGRIIWMVEERVYGPIVIPNDNPVSLPMSAIEQTFPYIFTVSSISDTLSQNYSASNNKLSIILLIFGVLITILEIMFQNKN